MKPKKGQQYRQVMFSDEMKQEIERVCQARGCSFSTFVCLAVEKALRKSKR